MSPYIEIILFQLQIVNPTLVSDNPIINNDGNPENKISDLVVPRIYTKPCELRSSKDLSPEIIVF